jgi:hypothetical protein
MRAFTLLLFVLTVAAGCLAYYGVGVLTETFKLAYAYLLLSTVASAAVNVSTRPAALRRIPARAPSNDELLR